MQQEQNLEILDIITILSFALQLQNTESHKIDVLRDQMSKTLNKDIKEQLNRIERKLDKLIEGESYEKGPDFK